MFKRNLFKVNFASSVTAVVSHWERVLNSPCSLQVAVSLLSLVTDVKSAGENKCTHADSSGRAQQVNPRHDISQLKTAPCFHFSGRETLFFFLLTSLRPARSARTSVNVPAVETHSHARFSVNVETSLLFVHFHFWAARWHTVFVLRQTVDLNSLCYINE